MLHEVGSILSMLQLTGVLLLCRREGLHARLRVRTTFLSINLCSLFDTTL